MPKQIPVRIAGAQIPCTPVVRDNVEHIKKAIDYAIENRCDYLVTPEGALSGYDHGGIAATTFGIDPFENLSDLEDGLKTVEAYAKDKVGLCLGTLWKEKERFGDVGRNQIRFYAKNGQLRGATNKSFCINPQDLPFMEHDTNKDGLLAWKLGDETFQFNVVGLVCNDMWGHGMSGHKAIPWHAKQQYNMGGRQDLQLFVHSTNGFRGNGKKMETLFNNWHHAHLTMMSYLSEIPIITVDNCYHMDGTEYHGQTSSESGVVVRGEFVTEVPRSGTQYFYHDFFGVTYE
jgi:hypothetical protein|tara:strand:+ start:3578 stop:4441 length:864 start_codon:yes stop_codon:yes gene_type:complete